MGQIPLVKEQIDGGMRLMTRLVETKFAVTAAAWVMETDGFKWYLYLVTPAVVRKGPTAGYRRLLDVMEQLHKDRFWVEPFEVRLIEPSSGVAKDIAAFLNQRRGKVPAWFKGSHLGEIEIEMAYVYAPMDVWSTSAAASVAE